MVYRNIETGIEIETQSTILAPNWTPVGAESPKKDPEPVVAADPVEEKEEPAPEEPKEEPKEAPKKTAAKKKPAKKGAKK